MAQITLSLLISFCLLHAGYSYSESTDCTTISSRVRDSLTGYASSVGKCFEFSVTGTASGAVWGSDIYTADSILSKAAVHAGLVRQGETKRVRVRILPGQSAYQATTRNGITTSGYGGYQLSYQFLGSSNLDGSTNKSESTDCTTVSSTPTSLIGYASSVGKCFEFSVTGTAIGAVWGSDIYTADSILSKAAVHAGVVRQGETKRVRIRILPGQSAYQATTRNGIITQSYDAYALSYQFIDAAEGTETSTETDGRIDEVSDEISMVCTSISPTPDSLSAYSVYEGKCIEFSVTGRASGSVWGSGIYTADSTLEKAAVHAGVVGVNETRHVRVRVLPGQSSYLATNRNGIISEGYGSFSLSYQFQSSSVGDVMPNCFRVSKLTSSLLESSIGKCFEISVTGASTAAVWGTDFYTADSSPDVAAVHAGVVDLGQTRRVMLRVQRGPSSYKSTTRYGITSMSQGSQRRDLCYQFLGSRNSPESCTVVGSTPANLSNYTSHVGKCFKFLVTGGIYGKVWGSGTYLASSSLKTAALHAGLVKSGEIKHVRVRVLAAQSSPFESTFQNGVQSESYGGGQLSYRFIDAPEFCRVIESTLERLNSIALVTGKCVEFRVTGRSEGAVWGSDIYTADSILGTAAVHAGVVERDETRRVRVQILPGQDSYQSTTWNGIRTTSYGTFSESFRFLGAIDFPNDCTLATSTPSSLAHYASEEGRCFDFVVTGRSTGALWGRDVYAADSSLGKAAVHAGVVRLGQTKLVRVLVLPGQSTYQSATQNGIASKGYGSFSLSYSFNTSWDVAESCASSELTTSGLTGYASKIGKCFVFTVTGTISGTVSGSDIYTANSSLSVAAVHAGVVDVDETKRVSVRVLPGQSSYQSTVRNAIRTQSLEAYSLSYQFLNAPEVCATLDRSPENLFGYSNSEGKCFEFSVTGSLDGAVWGSDIYTADSTLSAAAVHAGVVKLGYAERVRVRVLPGQALYQSVSRNGITSELHGSFGLSYQFIKWQ